MQSILANAYGRSKGSKIYRTPFGIRFYLIRAFCFLFLNFLSHKSLRLLTMHNELPTLLTIQVSYTNITILYLQNNTYFTYNKGAKQTTRNNSNGILKLTNSACSGKLRPGSRLILVPSGPPSRMRGICVDCGSNHSYLEFRDCLARISGKHPPF